MSSWKPIESAPNGVVVQTMIADEYGIHKECLLKRHGYLWWLPDGSMYVYYTPTHWKPVA